MLVRRLSEADAVDYRRIMLDGYASAPEAFTATVAEREPMPPDFWIQRVSDVENADERVYGAFDGDRLGGVAGLRFQTRPRTRHKAWLYGMYVRPELRGHGAGRRLVEAVLEGARERPGTLLVQLTVSDSNAAARRLYESCGFVPFGTEPMALRFDDHFVGKVHMWCDLRRVP